MSKCVIQNLIFVLLYFNFYEALEGKSSIENLEIIGVKNILCGKINKDKVPLLAQNAEFQLN